MASRGVEAWRRQWRLASACAAAAVVAASLSSGAPASAAWTVRLSVDGPTSAVLGQPYTYTITVANDGPATPVYLTADSNASAGAATASEGTCAVTPSHVSCDLGTLATGDTATISVTETPVDVDQVGHNLIAVPSLSGGSDSTHLDYYQTDVTSPSEPRLTDLRATISGPSTFADRSVATYTITIHNADTQPADNVTVLAQELGGGVRVDEGAYASTAPGTPCRVETSISPDAAACDIGTLAPGATVTVQSSWCEWSDTYPFRLQVQASQDWNGGRRLHQGYAQADATLTPTPTGGCPDPPVPPGPSADLSVSPVSQFVVDEPNANSRTSWQLTNLSANEADHVVFTDTVTPATTHITQIRILSGSTCPLTGQTSCVVGNMSAGESLTLVVDTDGPDGEVHHSVQVAHAGPDPVLANDTAGVDAAAWLGPVGGGGGGGSGGPPDLGVTVTADTAHIGRGGQDTFRIRVNDANGQAANDVRVIVALPPGATTGSAQSDRGPGCAADAVPDQLSCSLDYLSSDSPVGNITLILSLPTAGAATVTASASARQGDARIADNTGSATVQVDDPLLIPATAPRPRSTAPARHTINGNSKANRIFATPFDDLIHAGAGNDTVEGRGGDDTIYGGPGADRLSGGPGNDLLFGQAGHDTILGGPGNDTVHTVDGTRDTVDCGSGRDVVYADRIDLVARNCEVVHRR